MFNNFFFHILHDCILCDSILTKIRGTNTCLLKVQLLLKAFRMRLMQGKNIPDLLVQLLHVCTYIPIRYSQCETFFRFQLLAIYTNKCDQSHRFLERHMKQSYKMTGHCETLRILHINLSINLPCLASNLSMVKIRSVKYKARRPDPARNVV